MCNKTDNSTPSAAKIGILGGTFNPIHYGHLLLAENAREVYGLNQVFFMPSGNSYMKDASAIAAGEARAHMIELAISDNPYFALSRMELEREGPTYTCDTIRELRERYSAQQIYFLIGADNLLSLGKWKDPAYILKNCILIVAVRGTDTIAALQAEAARMSQDMAADIRFLPERSYDISSSEIRERVAGNISVRYLLPEAVEAYIREQRLYRQCEK